MKHLHRRQSNKRTLQQVERYLQTNTPGYVWHEAHPNLAADIEKMNALQASNVACRLIRYGWLMSAVTGNLLPESEKARRCAGWLREIEHHALIVAKETQQPFTKVFALLHRRMYQEFSK